MCIVYRVEHAETTIGPYYGANGFYFSSNMYDLGVHHELDGAHPLEGVDDGERFDERKWGFRDLKQLLAWFNHFGKTGYEMLEREGYVIRSYEVSERWVIEFARQVIFDFGKATQVSNQEKFPCF